MANKIGLREQILRPAAAPRDTFVMPNKAAGGLGQLADSLSALAPALSRYGNVLAADRGEKDKLEGENKAREFVEAHKTYKQAIEQGLIQKQHSPFYRMGAYETFGRASAYRFQEDFQKALAESPVSESTTPDDFDKFEGEFRNKWLKEHLGDKVDPIMQSAFGRQADNLINNDRSRFSSNAVQRLEGQVAESFQAEVHSLVKLGYEGHKKPEEVLSDIQLAMDRQIAGHMGKRVVNENVAEAIVSAAKRLNDTSVLDLMDKIKVGSGVMSGTSYGSKLREDAENEIASVNQASLVHAEQRKEKQKRDATDAITGELTSALVQDPDIDVKPYIERAIAAGSPEKADDYLNIQKRLREGTHEDVPEVRERLTIGVHSGYTNMARLDKALGSGTISFATYNSLASDVKTRDKEAASGAGGGKTALDDDYLQDLRRRVKAAIAMEDGDYNPERVLRAENAVTNATARYLEHRKGEGKNANDQQLNAWIHNEVIVQLHRNADPSTVLSLSSSGVLPDLKQQQQASTPGSRPQPVDAKKQLAAPREVIQRLLQDNADGKLSPASISVLRRYQVPPNKVQEWLDQQKKFLNP